MDQLFAVYGGMVRRNEKNANAYMTVVEPYSTVTATDNAADKS